MILVHRIFHRISDHGTPFWFLSSGILVPDDVPILHAVRTMNGNAKSAWFLLGPFFCLVVERDIVAMGRPLGGGARLHAIRALEVVRELREYHDALFFSGYLLSII